MIIDAIIFFNELDILEVRLNELDSIVDKFIILESLEMHGSDRVKPALLAENWMRFKNFEHKIKYVVLPRLEPPHQGPNDSWPRENFQRQQLMPIIEEVSVQNGGSSRDLVMISDCDEIPRAETIRHNMGRLLDGLYALNQELFYYNVNTYMGQWNGTVCGPLDRLRAGGPQYFRNQRDQLHHLVNGGWHLSYFGGRERILDKLGNFAHACEDSARLARHWIESGDLKRDELLSGRDLFRRNGCDRKEHRSSNDPRLPQWLRDNIARFSYFTEEGSTL